MLRKPFICLVAFLCLSSIGKAQTDYNNVPEVTTKIFINDVYIYQTARDSFGLGDILIDDGIIKNISAEIPVPVDAKIIEGDSAFVYPAFIDAYSHTAIPKPERSNERPDVKFRGYPPNDVAGITPEVLAVDALSEKDASIKKMVESGFAVVHSAPRGRMLPGQGAVISLNGKSKEEMIIDGAHSLVFQLTGARGVYPSTVIGVMSKWREMYKNAILYNENMDKYTEMPQGNSRPAHDPVLQALVPATKKQNAVYAYAQNAKDVYRQLALKEELGYKLVLVDVKQADPALTALKNEDVSIILSLDLPSEEKKKKDKKDASEEEAKGDEETEKLIERKTQAIEEYVAQAARLEAQGIDFAFSTNSIKLSKLKENLKRMVESGLSQEAALDALTINAAKLLGINDVTGSIHNGKLANLIICTDAYFDENSNIKYVLVEGQITENEIKKKKEGKAGAMDNILGEWRYSVDVMGEINSGKMVISQNEGVAKLLIVPDDGDGEVSASDVVFEDGNFSCSLQIVDEGATLNIVLKLDFEESSFSGTAIIGDLGTFPIEGNKITTPEK